MSSAPDVASARTGPVWHPAANELGKGYRASRGPLKFFFDQKRRSMCNLYSITKGQRAIIEFTRAMRDTTGNLPSLPGVFPDYLAPIVRNAPDGVRELMMARWGMPGPPQFGGAPITNIRNTTSAHWRGWLKPANRCVVPWTSFCEYADTKPRRMPTWFAVVVASSLWGDLLIPKCVDRFRPDTARTVATSSRQLPYLEHRR